VSSSARKPDAERQADVVKTHLPWFSSQDFGSLLREPAHRERLRKALNQAGL
jgi:hypothetical protein